MTTGVRALVTGSESGLGRAVASALGDLGVELVHDDPVALVVHAAVEGVRALAKSAARQWGGARIRVNCVAPRAELLAPDAGPLSPDVAEPALAGVPADVGAVASAITLLAAEGIVVTGATIVVDGGVVMIP